MNKKDKIVTSGLLVWLVVMRPKQWLKNGFVFAPLLFSFSFTDVFLLKRAGLAFVAFIIASSVVYIFNDIIDIEYDRKHPVKKARPIASGSISISYALMQIAMLCFLAAIVFVYLPNMAVFVILSYVLMNIIYSFVLKNIAILDVMAIASSFVLRVVAGGTAIAVYISPWIIICTFLLALFLGFAKRYNELEIISGISMCRNSMRDYNKLLLRSLINISCVSAFFSYIIYTLEISSVKNKPLLVYTSVFVLFGFFRYLQLLYVEKRGGEPEEVVLHDIPLIVAMVSWLVVTLFVLV